MFGTIIDEYGDEINTQSVSATVAVIVPNWNGKATLGLCLSSLVEQSIPVDIIVVDNGSSDGSAEYVRESYPSVRVIRNEKNLGFAGGVNTGIRDAIDKYDYLGLFNNDAIADRGWTENLLETLTATPSAGIATGLLLSRDGKTIDTTGEQYSVWGLPFPRQRGDNANAALTGGVTFGATGGASLYRSRMLKDVGLFDETFFAYYEDADLSFRAQLRGYSVIYTPFARAYHEHGTTSRVIPGFTVLQTFKNLPLLYLKNVPLPLILPVGVRFWTAYVLFFLNAVKSGKGVPALKGTLRFLILLPHALRERIRIQHTKILSAGAVRSLLWSDLPPDQHGIRRLRNVLTRR